MKSLSPSLPLLPPPPTHLFTSVQAARLNAFVVPRSPPPHVAGDGQTEERGGRRTVSDQATGGNVLGRREAETTCTWGKF